MTEKPTSPSTDEEHLRLLSIFYYVVGGLTALFGCFPMIHVTVGLIALLAPEKLKDSKGQAPPEWFGLLFVVFGGLIIVALWTFAALLVAAGRCLSLKRHYLFCLVVAVMACLCQPWGTALGIFTIIVLMRESVKQEFAANKLASTGSAAGGTGA